MTTHGLVTVQNLPLHSSILTRVTIKPGGSWFNDLKPLVKTDSCEKAHAGVVPSGKLGVRMDDGTEEEFGVAPGHDAWCVGEEECVFV
jgi:hypothetical protein